MNDLFSKLNTLLKANLNTSLDELVSNIPGRHRHPDMDKQVRQLRDRINKALAYEDELMKRVQELEAEAQTLDDAVNAALKADNEEEARYLLQQLQRVEQRLSMAESDLRSHQRVAEELIRQVNMLDATVADNKAAEQQKKQAPEAPSTATEAPDEAEDFVDEANRQAEETLSETRSSMNRISGMLRDAQERARARIQSIAGDDDEPRVMPEVNEPPPVAAKPAPKTKADKTSALSDKSDDKSSDDSSSHDASSDEMASRLARLSKPENKQD